MAPNTLPDAKTAARPTPGISSVERMEYEPPRPTAELPSHPTPGLAALPAFQSVEGGNFSRSNSTQPEVSEHTAQTSASETHWAQMAADLEARLAREMAQATQAIAAAREEGRREGYHAAEAGVGAEQQKSQARVAAALEAFRLERQKYFKNVEREIVRLALAIAARVLHREAQLDPLFLTGAVRVALDTLADSSGVVLRVAPGQTLIWQESFRLSADFGAQPEILGDLSLAEGECVLETRIGTIEVGVRAQLEEIEKGFFDLLDQRPASIAGMVKRAG